jgi:hypothetical protein
MRWIGHAACIREMTNVYNILVGKPQVKRPFGRPRLRREDDIKIGIKEAECKRLGSTGSG